MLVAMLLVIVLPKSQTTTAATTSTARNQTPSRTRRLKYMCRSFRTSPLRLRHEDTLSNSTGRAGHHSAVSRTRTVGAGAPTAVDSAADSHHFTTVVLRKQRKRHQSWSGVTCLRRRSHVASATCPARVGHASSGFAASAVASAQPRPRHGTDRSPVRELRADPARRRTSDHSLERTVVGHDL